MVGIQRFFWLLILTALVMICFPDFGLSGWTFAGTFILIWTGIILRIEKEPRNCFLWVYFIAGSILRRRTSSRLRGHTRRL